MQIYGKSFSFLSTSIRAIGLIWKSLNRKWIERETKLTQFSDKIETFITADETVVDAFLSRAPNIDFIYFQQLQSKAEEDFIRHVPWSSPDIKDSAFDNKSYVTSMPHELKNENFTELLSNLHWVHHFHSRLFFHK